MCNNERKIWSTKIRAGKFAKRIFHRYSINNLTTSRCSISLAVIVVDSTFIAQLTIIVVTLMLALSPIDRFSEGAISSCSSSSRIVASSSSSSSIPAERTHGSWPKELRVVYCCPVSFSFYCPSLALSLSLTPRVWNHSEVVLVLSPPTSHLLNEPSIDRRHFAVSRFPSHLAAAPAIPTFRSPISLFPAVLPLSGGLIDLIFSLPT